MKIVLIGFMGSGKSSVGSLLAARMSLELIESDELVLEKSQRSSISEIFLECGEAAFRALEREVAKELEQRDNCVISTGGGMPIAAENAASLRANGGTIVYLFAAFSEIERRLDSDSTRPLFQEREKAQLLYKERHLMYEKLADTVVSTDDLSAVVVAGLVQELVGEDD